MRGTTLLLFLCGGCPPPVEEGSAAPRRGIVLAQVAVASLPQHQAPQGGAFGLGGRVLIWTSDAVIAFEASLGSRAAVCPGRKLAPIAAAFHSSNPRVVEVLVRKDATVQRLVASGTACRTVDSSVSQAGFAPQAATRVGGRWAVLFVSADTAAAPRLMVQAPGDWTPVGVEWLQIESVDHRQLYLADSNEGDELIIGLLQAPFTWWRIGLNGHEGAGVEEAIRPPVFPLHTTAPGGLWIALPPIRLTGQTLQTFSDVTSDIRVLATYSAEGQILHSRIVHSPIGLIAGYPRENLVLAAAALDVPVVLVDRLTGNGL